MCEGEGKGEKTGRERFRSGKFGDRSTLISTDARIYAKISGPIEIWGEAQIAVYSSQSASR